MRQAQGNLSDGDVDYICCHGLRTHNAGAVLYFLREKDLPSQDKKNARVLRLVNVAVLVSPDGSVSITTYRNPDALRDYKRKPKYARYSTDAS